MKPSSVISGCIALLFLSVSQCHLFMKDGFVGVGVDLAKLGLAGEKCPNTTEIACECGKTEAPVPVTIAVCSYSHRWKVRCKPCNDRQESDVCDKYHGCLHCHPDGKDGEDRCATCPLGKFGEWCQKDCTCVNDAFCEQDGKCLCQDGFEGKNCEKKIGCNPPGPLMPLLEVTLTPPNRPMTAVYTCPRDHELKGIAISTCSNNLWSSDPPQCLRKCPLLSVPANGKLALSRNELVEGATAEVTCNQNYRLIGEKRLVCLPQGEWSAELPSCEKLAFCPDPGNTQNAERTVLSDHVQLANRFVEGSIIQYKCKTDYEQVGVDTIICRFNGTWSEELPSCIKVSTVIPNCRTKGAEIVSDEGVSVRIICPPECADEAFTVWGTSIYRQDSSVCQAAVHSAKITNSGGPVAVINNGLYSHFTGSHSNNVESKSFSGREGSFRFDKLPPLGRKSETKACEQGLVQMNNVCIYVSSTKRTNENAKAICSNMGLRLMPELPNDRQEIQNILTVKGINSIWNGGEKLVQPNTEEMFLNSSETQNITESGPMCEIASLVDGSLKREVGSCTVPSNFVCVRKQEDLAICEDLGPLTDGTAVAVGQIEGTYYVGSSIEFSCNPRHYLKGEVEIACLGNGTWSDPKPACIKVDACEDPPIPQGGIVTYLPPLKATNAQRSATYNRQGMMGSRAARLPSGLAANFSASPRNSQAPSTTPEPETVPLPAGLHRIGSRAMYDCESRYYNLIGSRTRRCETKGQWSGRPPTCMPVCGRSDSPKLPFVWNGNATDIAQWPWQAGIARYLPDYGQWFLLCGASLLNERWVVTAAHCVTYAGTTLPIEADKFQVYLGKYHRQDSKDDEYVQVRKIEEMHIHPDYDPGLFDADIALLRLDEAVQLNSRVQPVCLPTEQTTRDNLVDGKKGVVTGWGMDENSSYSETLRQAALPVVTREQCEKGYDDAELPLTVTENMFCAGFAQGRSDACSGDSGGPMVFLDSSSKERKWILEGIVSWGSPQGCGNPNQYGGFTTVSRFLDWIHLFF